jgi:RND family efflux transporter MFP subunit
MERVVSLTGTLAAHEQSTLSAKVSGRLQKLNVDLGSQVKEGDILAQVEPRDYELKMQQAAAALAQARAALGLPGEGADDRCEVVEVSTVREARAVLDEAAGNRDRIRALSASGIASPSEMDASEAAFKVASTRHAAALEEAHTRQAALAQRRVEFEIAKKQMDDTALRAPFDGVVQGRPASPGEFVSAGMPIVTLVKPNPLRLRLELPERDAPLARLGQTVRLSVEGDTNVYVGTVARMSPALTESSRVLLIEADVPPQGALRPGLFARAQLVVSEREESLSIPANALLTFAGLEKVVIAMEGKAVERAVVTGRRGAGWVEIRSGLNATNTVVSSPAGLRSGQPLVVEAAAGTVPSAPAGTAAVRGSH